MNKKTLLSILWLVLTANFMFCDIFTLMHSADLQNLLKGRIDGMEITQSFLLSFAVVMEIPILLILLSRILPYRPNRIIQIIAGLLLIIVQSWSLTVDKITLHYWFFSLIEILILVIIVWQAAIWQKQQTSHEIL